MEKPKKKKRITATKAAVATVALATIFAIYAGEKYYDKKKRPATQVLFPVSRAQNQQVLPNSMDIDRRKITRTQGLQNQQVVWDPSSQLDFYIGLLNILVRHEKDVCMLNPTCFNMWFNHKNKNNIQKNIKYWPATLFWICDTDKLHVPDDFGKQLAECKEKKKKAFIIPLLIKSCTVVNTEERGHTNAIVMTIDKNVAERFEPHGFKLDSKDFYDEKIMDNRLAAAFFQHGFTYLNPQKICPVVYGFQLLQQDRIGYCSVWSMFYFDLRLTFPGIDPERVVTLAMNIIQMKTSTNINAYANFIENYAKLLTNTKNKILEKCGNSKEKALKFVSESFTNMKDIKKIINDIDGGGGNLKKCFESEFNAILQK